jgi:hypothetical protein
MFIALASAGWIFGSGQTHAVDLLSVDFEDVQLDPVVTFESELRERKAWSQTSFPAATGSEVWSIDNTNFSPTPLGDPNIGVLEFEGWSFINRDWWVATAGNQGRADYVSASGTIAVADPDEWDDFSASASSPSGSDSNAYFDSTMRVSNINLQNAAPNSVNLFFHSSWRPELGNNSAAGGQKASLTVNYNDTAATSIELFRWVSDPLDGNFHPDATNETINIPIFNPAGATAASLEFRLFDAGNNWWWAVDNLSMFTGDAPGQDGALRLIINRDTGSVKVVNNTGTTVNLRGYSIESRFGALNEDAATFLGDADPNWVVLNGPNSSELAEGHYNFSPLAANAEIDLGNSWRKFYEDVNDISFQYSVEGVSGPKVGIIQFTGTSTGFDFLDLNYDGTVNFADYQTFLDGYGSTSLAGKLQAERHNLGDLNNDSKFSVADFLEFKNRFEASGQFAMTFAEFIAGGAVPEPASLVLLAPILAAALIRRRRAVLALVAVVISLGLTANDASAQLTLFSENFDSIPLGQSPEEEPDQFNVWSETGPAGWIIDDSGMPGLGNPDTDGVVDWAGWAFVNKDWWVSAAGDQTRSLFTRARGNVMVADPDEWEDAPNLPGTAPNYNLYDAKATTPSIAIPAGIPNGKIFLAFDSSWRPEGMDDGAVGDTNNQTGTLKVSFGGGAQQSLIAWDSDPDSLGFHPDSQNEGIEIQLPAHNGATSMRLEFFLGNAWNDWWWAVDNLRVFVPAEPSILTIDVGTGMAQLTGGDVINAAINAIDIFSANGNLAPAANTGLSTLQPDAIDGPDADSVVGNSLDENWQLAAANANYFSEFFLSGKSDFDSSRTVDLGRLFNTSTSEANRDVLFTYTTFTGETIVGEVNYVGSPPVINPDFNGDGRVDGKDFLAWQRGFGRTGQTNNAQGDANGDGVVNGADLAIWAGQFGPSPAQSAAHAVPEPAAGFLAGLVCSVLASFRTRRSRRCVMNWQPFTSARQQQVFAKCARPRIRPQWQPNRFQRGAARVASLSSWGTVVMCAFLVATPSGWAQVASPSLDRDYKFGDDDPGAVAGGTVNTTRDLAGQASSSTHHQERVLLTGSSNFFIKPTYAAITGRPDGKGGLGIQLQGSLQQFLTSGFQGALNLPIRSPSSTQSDLETPNSFNGGAIEPGTINYQFITDRGFQLWTKPASLPTGSSNADIVMDSNNHGVLIQNGGKFAMRYSNSNYTGVTTAVPGQWYHLSVVRAFGPGSGSILYVNGVAEAAATGVYLGEQDLTGEVILPPSALDDSPLIVGANTSENPNQLAKVNFYSGIVDDLEMFVMGFNTTADFGEFQFGRDNDYAAAFGPSVVGDLNGDNLVTRVDVETFAANYRSSKVLTWTQGQEQRSLVVGDLSTRAIGDFNYDGRVNLRDWEILNDASPSMAAVAMNLINGLAVPEPAGGSLALIALVAAARRRRENDR